MYIFYVLASLWIVKKKNKELKWSNYPAKNRKQKQNYGSELKKKHQRGVKRDRFKTTKPTLP